MLDALVAEARLRWGLDPASGLQIASADRLASLPIEPTRPLLLVPPALLRVPEAAGGAVPQPGRGAGDADPLAVLRRLYPADHPVGRIGIIEQTTVDELEPAVLGGAIYLPPAAPELATASPWSLPWIAARLRQPDGCPWDREQTHQSLKQHLLEEAYEVYDALDAGATAELAGELGDLLLQVVLHAELAAEAGVFDMADVQAAIGDKIVRRHPHVFGDATVRTAGDVNRQWEQIKKAERERAAAAADAADAEAAEAAEADAGAEPGGTARVGSALDGISPSMPALAASQEMQERAAHLGYDWPDIVGVVDKIHEELAELQAAATPEERREEVGDLLLVIVNLARREGVQAEDALRAAGQKFRRRFGRVERLAAERRVALRDLGLAELDELWEIAKAEERAAPAASHQGAADPDAAATTEEIRR